MKRLILAILVGFIFTNLLYAETLTLLTEEYPPFNYKKNGKITGITTEIVRSALNEIKDQLDLEVEFQIKPWARSYQSALTQKNIGIFGLTRTNEREDLFKWAGLLLEVSQCLIMLSEHKPIKFETIKDLQALTIGTVRSSAFHQTLLSKGFDKKKIYATNNPNITILMLLNKRFDMAAVVMANANYYLAKNGFNPKQKIKKVHCFQSLPPSYLAFSTGTSDKIVRIFSEGIQRIRNKGVIDRIVQEYR